ncbi:hypothetical protein BGZ46_007404 [Entomortierella lignicola]|nr:hypothetical protein BGZ46_007404 [Entomortierella lignicola]
MTPIASIIILAASLLGSLASPGPVLSPSITHANTTYTGTVSTYTEHHNACHDIKYSADEPIATVSTAIFGNIGHSVCGKYVKISPHQNPLDYRFFKIVDVCPECEESSLGLSSAAMNQLGELDTPIVDWELIDADDKPHILKRKVNNKYRGRGTWFSDKIGSCGIKFSQKDMIVALNEAQMGRMWGKGSKCGKKIRVKSRGSSRSIVVKVVDTCPHRYCSHGQLDLSQAAFKKFAPMSQGILDLEWSFV